jgi:hypothetical protein
MASCWGSPRRNSVLEGLKDRKLDVIQFWTEDILVSSCEILSEKLVVESEM